MNPHHRRSPVCPRTIFATGLGHHHICPSLTCASLHCSPSKERQERSKQARTYANLGCFLRYIMQYLMQYCNTESNHQLCWADALRLADARCASPSGCKLCRTSTLQRPTCTRTCTSPQLVEVLSHHAAGRSAVQKATLQRLHIAKTCYL